MKILKVSLLTIALSISTFSQQPGTTAAEKQDKPLPPAVSPLSPSMCGQSAYDLTFAGKSVGHETFEIKCVAGGGFSASGKTKMDVAGTLIDLNTTIDTDKAGVPLKFSVKGNTGGQAIDQTIVVNKDVASVVSNGVSQETPFNGGVIFVGNVIYLSQFLVARYEVAKGGAQKISIFGDGQMTIERTARDEVQPVGLATAPSTPFDRYSVRFGPATIMIWTDDKGRVALINVPAQNFTAVREDYQAFAQPLHTALLASVRGLVPDYSAPANAAFTAEEVKIKTKDFILAGTLLLPRNAKGRLPVVVTSTGSGQQTRDEPLPLPGLEDYKLFSDDAERR